MATPARPGLDRTMTPRLPARYVPLRPLAHGATATVWCAEDRRLHRRVAVKLLAEPYASEPAAVQRFVREARAVARLSTHPHVVTIFDVGTTLPEHPGARGRPFLVMEHVPGGTVADALRLGAYDAPDAVRWVAQAAQALDFAHAHGIVHRDVKPANLLLDADRNLHVADFGIAQTAGQQTVTRQREVLGTAIYLPPERVLGRPATMASDLYSLAVVAFELLTGERPFAGAGLVELARQHLDAERPRASRRNPALPRAVDSVLARGLARDPQERWPSAGAMAAALSQALTPPPIRRPRRRAPVAALLLALIGAVVLAAGATSGGGAPLRPRAHASRAPARSLGQAADASAGLLRTSDVTPVAPASTSATFAPAPRAPAPVSRPSAAVRPRHGEGARLRRRGVRGGKPWRRHDGPPRRARHGQRED